MPNTQPSVLNKKLMVYTGVLTSLLLVTAMLSYFASSYVGRVSFEYFTHGTDRIITSFELTRQIERKVSSARGYLITNKADYMTGFKKSQDNIEAILKTLEIEVKSPAEQALLLKIRALDAVHSSKFLEISKQYQSQRVPAEVFESELRPSRSELSKTLQAYVELVRDEIHGQSHSMARTLRLAQSISLIAALGLILLALLALSQIRRLQNQKNSLDLYNQQMLLEQKKRNELESLINELHDSKLQLRRLALRMQDVQEAERTTISRELHDEFGQSLTVLKLKLFDTKRKLEPSSNLQDALGESIRVVNETVEQMRNFASRLRPALVNEDLEGALEWLCTSLAKDSHFEINFNFEGEEERMSDKEKVTFFRICQEALTNAIRHSGAKRVDVNILMGIDEWMLEIRDYGQGLGDRPQNRGLGLLGMSERAFEIGGQLEITDAIGGGCLVSLIVPINKKGEINASLRSG